MTKFDEHKADKAYQNDCLHCRLLEVIKEYMDEHEDTISAGKKGEGATHFAEYMLFKLAEVLVTLLSKMPESEQHEGLKKFMDSMGFCMQENNMGHVHVSEERVQ